MAVINIEIQASGATCIMFDCRRTSSARDDEARIERAIALSLEAARFDEASQGARQTTH